MLWMKWHQTKRISHHPWCGDDAYALGLGVLKPHAMVWAKAARRHGWHQTCQIIYSQEGVSDLVQMYVGYHRPSSTHTHLLHVGWRNHEILKNYWSNLLVLFFCLVFYVKFNTTSNVRTYGGTTRIYGLTDGRTDGQTDELIWGGWVTYGSSR
jgi:hypothetical protein